MGGRQPHRVLRGEASRDAARVQGPQTPDRDGSERRSRRLRAGRHELLHVGRHDQGRTLHRDPCAQHRRERDALRRRREPGRIQGVPAARARSPVWRRAPRRTVDHPHELEGAEFPADGSERRRGIRPRALARDPAASRRRVHPRIRRVQRISRDRASARADCARFAFAASAAARISSSPPTSPRTRRSSARMRSSTPSSSATRTRR